MPRERRNLLPWIVLVPSMWKPDPTQGAAGWLTPTLLYSHSLFLEKGCSMTGACISNECNLSKKCAAQRNWQVRLAYKLTSCLFTTTAHRRAVYIRKLKHQYNYLRVKIIIHVYIKGRSVHLEGIRGGTVNSTFVMALVYTKLIPQ